MHKFFSVHHITRAPAHTREKKNKMQVDSCGKLLRCVLQITRIVERFRSMHQSHDSWISDYARSFHQIDTGLDPDLFQATAAAFASLLLMHKNSPDCDWLRPSVKRKKKKKKSKKKSLKQICERKKNLCDRHLGNNKQVCFPPD